MAEGDASGGHPKAGTAGPADLIAPGPLWVFGYGSLIWSPCFPFVESQRARLYGYHRSLCILSIRNRGTRERPGLALGLDRGGSCTGRAFLIQADAAAASATALWEREMATAVYDPRCLDVRLASGQTVKALVFVARPGHPQYVSGLSEADAAALVRQGNGCYGSALDYLRNICAHLDECRIKEGPLHRILALAESG